MANFDFLNIWNSLDDEEKKRLQEQAQGGLLSIDEDESGPASQVQGPTLLDTSLPFPAAPSAPAAEPEKQNKTMFGLLDNFVPADDAKREALAMALIQGGGGAMMAGGPSKDPVNFLQAVGAGVSAGAKGYANAREEARKSALQDATLGASKVKLQQAQANRDAVASIGIDPNSDAPMTISQMKALYALYLQNGKYSEANALLERIQQLDDSQRKTGAVLGPDGYELAPGVAQSAEDLSRAKDAGQYTSDRKDYEFGQENPDFRKQKLEEKRAGATNITNGGGSDKQIFDTMLEENKNARQAQQGLKGIYEARQAVESGGVFGAGADTILGLRKVAQLFGVGDPDKITNTETFRSAIAPQVAAVIKQTVGSANISDNDRAFAEKAAGGNIELDEGSIKRLLDIMERANKEIINQYNSKVDTVYPGDNDGFKRERAVLGGVTVPDYKPAEKPSRLLDIGSDGKPAGASGDIPTVNTPEERAKIKSGQRFMFRGKIYTQP